MIREHWLTGVVVACGFAVVVICLALMSVDSGDCLRGSVTAAGIAWCR